MKSCQRSARARCWDPRDVTCVSFIDRQRSNVLVGARPYHGVGEDDDAMTMTMKTTDDDDDGDDGQRTTEDVRGTNHHDGGRQARAAATTRVARRSRYVIMRTTSSDISITAPPAIYDLDLCPSRLPIGCPTARDISAIHIPATVPRETEWSVLKSLRIFNIKYCSYFSEGPDP